MIIEYAESTTVLKHREARSCQVQSSTATRLLHASTAEDGCSARPGVECSWARTRNHTARAEKAQAKKKSPAEVAAIELKRATSRVRAVTRHSLQVAKSSEYQVVGDAQATFIQTSLRDYGAIANDFLAHYQAKGFQVKAPERRMTLVAFFDERPFREFARKFARGVPSNVSGFYSRPENWLVLFDFRNVPASALGGAQKNVRILAHEATHQLTFNTGLLNRQGDAPAAIIEGLACYGEVRRLRGPNELGILNSERLDDLAHVHAQKEVDQACRFADRRLTSGRRQLRSDATLLRPELDFDLQFDERARAASPA